MHRWNACPVPSSLQRITVASLCNQLSFIIDRFGPMPKKENGKILSYHVFLCGTRPGDRRGFQSSEYWPLSIALIACPNFAHQPMHSYAQRKRYRTSVLRVTGCKTFPAIRERASECALLLGNVLPQSFRAVFRQVKQRLGS